VAESTLCLLAFFVEKVVLDDLLQGGTLPPVKDQQISQPWCGEGLDSVSWKWMPKSLSGRPALAAEKGIWHLPCASQPVLPVSRHDSISQPFPKALLPAAEARSWEEVPPICCNSRYRSVGSCVSQSGLIALMQAEQASMKESR